MKTKKSKIKIRIPIPSRSGDVILPKKGKGSYTRKEKHKKRYTHEMS